MEYRKEVKAAYGTKSYEKKSLLDGMVAPDGLIDAFCKSFSIQISTEFSEHRNLVIEAIRKNQNVSGYEASLDFNVNRAWKVGGSYAYTKGATKQKGSWTALPATRIAPPKFTAYVSYAPGTYSVRLQGVRVGGI
jgi:outer membrane receptor for monomeric catechols